MLASPLGHRANRKPMTDNPAITLKDVEVWRGGKPVLRGIDLSIVEGAITAVIGVSGAGKSTLLSVLSGARAPEKGAVVNSALGDLRAPDVLLRHRRQTASIYQDHALIGRLTALDNVVLGLADQLSAALFFLPPPKPLQIRAAEALDEVGLLAKSLVRVDDLSGGERQRVAIARALIREPKLMIADEPFASVDPGLADRFASSLRQTVERHQTTVVVALHQMHLAMRMADHVIALAAGRVIVQAPISKVLPADLDRIFRPGISHLGSANVEAIGTKGRRR
jgi:phosphonate transport system ATP-binding protein